VQILFFMPWIIGDIHGCLSQLNELLDLIPDDGEKRIFLGDYIDRGPDSAGVVDRLLKDRENSIFLKGNHEVMLLEYYLHNDKAWLWPANGAADTLRSYGMNLTDNFDKLPESHQEFFLSLLPWYEAKDFICVHAGFNPENGTDLSRQNTDDLYWIREHWILNEQKWKGKHVYFGHTVTDDIDRFFSGPNLSIPNISQTGPFFGKKSTGLDTGCVYGGRLTAIHHPSKRVISIS
jgi:serine/threonine protein phosphatase 1